MGVLSIVQGFNWPPPKPKNQPLLLTLPDTQKLLLSKPNSHMIRNPSDKGGDQDTG
jgi:hypothetical protein